MTSGTAVTAAKEWRYKLESISAFFQNVLSSIETFLENYPMVGTYYTEIVKFVFPVLALLILVGTIRSLLKIPHIPETWAHLGLPNGAIIDIDHWENVVGRGKNSDVLLNYPQISRQHAALIRREDGTWSVHDLDSKGGTKVNGRPIVTSGPVEYGDTISFAGVPVVLLPLSDQEQEARKRARMTEKPKAPYLPMFLLTVFQVLAMFQLIVALGNEVTVGIPTAFILLIVVEWCYLLILRVTNHIGFEMETIAFFMTTIGLAIVSSSAPDGVLKQFVAFLIGLALFIIIGIFLRDLNRVQKVRWFMAGMTVLLLLSSIVFGTTTYGASNWVSIGGLSLQPSELAKITFIFAGTATLERLFRKRNIWGFIILTGVCGACLAVMSDFGTAAIFFVTFLVIAYMRSGDVATLGLICGGCALGIAMLVSLKPYILDRFAVWGHVWENASDAGFQQTRTMSAAASGGLVGIGAGNGFLKNVFAGNSDLVFGMICEEWGLIIAVLCVACIITLAFFAVRACAVSRSTLYPIAACATAALLVVQTSLNVFGSVDILPLTGVTFPFISAGGSSMMSTWGLLAFLKATDTRENASFALKRFRTSRQERLKRIRYEEEGTAGAKRNSAQVHETERSVK